MANELSKAPCNVHWIDSPGLDPANDNIDVYIEFKDGRNYVATGDDGLGHGCRIMRGRTN